MRRLNWCATLGVMLCCVDGILARGSLAQTSQSGAVQRIDLAERLAAGRIRTVNREIAPLAGTRGH